MTDAFMRPLRQQDAPKVLDAFRSADDMRRQGDVTDARSAESYVRDLLDPSRDHRPWAICDADGELVGLVVVSVDIANANGWFWYWLHHDHRGHGLASRGALAVANWAIDELGLHRLELGYRVNNPASGAVARAAGFVREGLEREKFLVDGLRVDVVTCSRLASDPRPAGDGLTLRMASPDEGCTPGSAIEFRTHAGAVTPDMIDGFFVGWPEPPSADALIAVMDASYRRVWAVQGGRVIGYVNAISDGVLNAFIPWLEVHPDHQGRGVGQELVSRMVAELGEMYAIDLCCDPELVGWYERQGFIGFAGAGLRNRSALTR